MVRRLVAPTAVLASALAASPLAGAGELDDCGQRVLRDWYSGGRVDRQYPLSCYRAAIRALPDDVLQYTDAGAAIERALASARQRRAEGSERAEGRKHAPPADTAPPVTTKAPKATTPDNTSAPGRDAVAPDPPEREARLARGPARRADAGGVPYPLIALAALAAVLLVSGVAAGLAQRRH
ncbi:MAG TPA: hypothetical protein VH305_10325 [Gaiella sp.]